MKYNGEELIEITAEKWDGKTRQMLVWNGNDSCHLAYVVGYKHTHTTKHGFIEYDVEWLSTDGYYWQHCADIPNNESNEKFSIDYIIKTLTERTQDEYWMPFDNCIVEYLKSLKEIKEENEKLKKESIARKESEEDFKWERDKYKKESEELKEYIKSLRADRVKMADEVSSAVWKELMSRAKNIEERPINTAMVGFGFNDISDLVLNKILDYTSENKQPKEDKPNLKVGKWYYCYKNLFVPNAVRSCCVPTAIEGNFVFDGKFFVVPNASLIVDDDYVTYDLNTTIKYEASTFDKIEELREKKPHKINDSWVGEWLSNTCVDKDACNEPMIKD